MGNAPGAGAPYSPGRPPIWAPDGRLWRPGMPLPGMECGNALGYASIGVPLRRGRSRGGGGSSGTLISGCVAFWGMDEASGTRNDSIGTVHLTESGTVPQTTGIQSFATSWANNASNFLSKATGLSALDRAANNQIDVVFWWQMSSAASTQVLLHWNSSATSSELIWKYDTGGSTFEATIRGTTIISTVFTGNDFGLNTWYMTQLFDDGTNVGFRVNNSGTFVQTAARPATASATMSAIRFGENSSGTQPFRGKIDHVLVRKGSVFNANERAYLYNAGAARSFADIQAASP